MLLPYLLYALLFSTAAYVASAHPTSIDVSQRIERRTSRQVISKAVNAIGAQETLQKIKTFSYQASKIYRSSTLTQNYNLFTSDQSVSAAGSQNMSFSMTDGVLDLRIDRSYVYDNYWIWAHADLEPTIDFSLVIRDGVDGYACFNKGQNSFFSADPLKTLGYADPYLTQYLIHQAHQFALPWLMMRFVDDSDQVSQYQVQDDLTSQTYLALEHKSLGLAMLVNETSHILHAIRSYEHHVVYGKSTSDLVLSDWYEVDVSSGSNCTIRLPHRFQTVYNSETVLEDFVVDSITMNSENAADFFDAHATKDSSASSDSSERLDNAEYPMAEVHEFFESGLWSGAFGEAYNSSDVVITHPIPEFKEIMALYIGYPDYVQLLIEFEDGLLITDAPPHRSKIILDWVDTHMSGKRLTRVVPSHHHRDHAGGVADFVAAGATLVVPEIARGFYNMTGGVTDMVTYTDDQPFILNDSHIQFRSYWKDENQHARDWSFGVVGPAKLTEDDKTVIFSADVINPGTDARKWDTGAARGFISQLIEAEVPRSSVLVGSHGSTDSDSGTSEALASIVDTVGIAYPPSTGQDWNSRSKR